MSSQDSPYTIANAVENPSLLTRNSKPLTRATPLKSYEGRVRNVIANTEMLVTSPNMSILCKPPLNLTKLAHLACIRVQFDQLDDPSLDTAWTVLTDKDFVKSPFPPDAPQKDQVVGEGAAHLQRLLDRLDVPATKSETFLRFACAQRQLLELLARYEWVTIYWDKFEGKDVPETSVATQTIVGAFVEDEEPLDALFRAGIPVWYMRLLSCSPNAHIDTVVRFIEEKPTQKIDLRFGGE
ncbi:hypothetical protein AAF712_016537, partial [Marasmius tenuissimus]